MRNLRTALLLVACLSLLSYVTSPLSRSPAELAGAVTLQASCSPKGDPHHPGVNQNMGSLDTLGSTVSSANGMSENRLYRTK